MRRHASDDDALMLRYARGEVDAFEELFRRYEGRVYGFCLRYLGDPDAAADAFQDTFRRLVESRARYEPRGRFASWLFTLARRACVDRLRERSDPEPLEPPRRRAGGRWPPGAGRASLRSPAPGPEEESVRRSEIRRLLSTLPESQREALLLSKYHGFSYAEIADMVGATEAAVKQRVYRALNALRRLR